MLYNKADRVLSECIRLYYKHICLSCGDTASDAAHIVSRKRTVVRWFPLNIVALCRRCHAHFGDNPLLFASFLQRYVPDGSILERLLLLSSNIRVKKPDIEAIYQHYVRQRSLLKDASKRAVIARIEPVSLDVFTIHHNEHVDEFIELYSILRNENVYY